MAHDDVTNAKMEEGLTRLVEQQRDPERPLFLFAYFWDPHYDFIPPAPYDEMFVGPDDVPIDAGSFETNPAIHRAIREEQRRWILSQYAGEIRWTDEHLGRFFALLKRHGLWDDALVIVTADHGEEFFEHGEKGHKNNLHAETVHVPLIVKYPGQRVGRQDGRLVSLVDVLPTVREVVALGPSRDPVQGVSLLAAESPGRTVLYELLSVFYFRQPDGSLFSRESRHFGVREGSWKLLWNDTGSGGGLFDLARDPRERASFAGKAERRQGLMAAFEAETERSRKIASNHDRCEAKIAPDEIEVLCALGYLTDCD
jgi:arylsulfatase A-like enzyme